MKLKTADFALWMEKQKKVLFRCNPLKGCISRNRLFAHSLTQFLHKVSCQKPCWDQARLSSLVKKQVADQPNQFSKLVQSWSKSTSSVLQPPSASIDLLLFQEEKECGLLHLQEEPIIGLLHLQGEQLVRLLHLQEE